jgi:DNA-directed RNA polymerase
MAGANTAAIEVEDDVALSAKIKKDILYNFYDSVRKGGEALTCDDLTLAIEALELAKLDIKEREDKKRREREAELLKQKIAEDEERRRAAEERARKRAQREREKNAEKISAMELPLDFVNSFADDA